MAIRFRCTHCTGLLSISSRKAGALVTCPTCGEQTLVPWEDAFTSPVGDEPSPPESPPAEAAPASEFRPAAELDEQIVFSAYGDAETEPSVSPLEREGPEPDEELVDLDRPDAPVAPPAEGPVVPRRKRPPEPAEEVEEPGPPFQVRSRRLVDDDEDMDLTPMVDVTFLLLIFFMITASFSLQKSIETPTPQPDQQGAAQSLLDLEDLQGTSILVKIDAQNALTVDDEPWPDLGRLAEALRDKMRREQKSEVIITADSAALHRTVVTVIDAANEAGIQKIRLGSRRG